MDAGRLVDGQHLAGAVGGLLLAVPEAHQQEGAQPHRLPAQVQQEQVGRVDQVHEPGDEQQDQRIEAGRTLLVGHVGNGVEQDGRADPGRHQGEQKG